MRYSKCMLTGKRFVNLKAVVYTQLSKHTVYELGETLYSGPPSKDKEGERNHVSSSVYYPLAAELEPKEPADSLSSEQILSCVKEVQPTLGFLRNLDSSDVTDLVNNFEEKTVVCKLADSVEKDTAETLHQSDENLKINNKTVSPIPIQNDDGLNKDNSFNHCVNGDQNIQKEMVRLIQEPKSKIDPHSLRRGIRVSKTRVGSGDFILPNPTPKIENSKCRQNQKELRNRRVNCLSDRSDSECSEQFGNDDLTMCEIVDKHSSRNRKPKINDASVNDENHISTPNKVNGELTTCAVNGVNKLKARRVSRANSDDSDVSSPKVNGIDIDNDRVDINLLLEISAKDRKRFENKKAKIKRKCADWMLITETEQYYNEKEEILRNKSREDSETESDSSVNDEKQKPKEKKTADSKQSSKGKKSKKIIESASSRKVVKSSSSNRVLSKKQSADVESGNNCNEFVTRNNGKGKSFMDRRKEIDLKPRKRLSDAERFLRDNKEYYQFPETRDRLRRNTSYADKDCLNQSTILEEELEEEEENEDDEDEEEDLEVEDVIKNEEQVKEKVSKEENTSLSNKTNSVVPLTNKNRKGGKRRRRKGSRRTSSDNEADLPKKEEVKQNKVSEESEYKTLDGLYFSFEGAPIQESWYQTYQRYIDGVESNEFVYEHDHFKFVLPYEMPKEYFKELHGKKSLLSRKKSELADLVRKSPRCHASTLALFSNIFPGRKRKSRQCKPIKIEDNSSDGTNTPIPEVNKFTFIDTYETEEEMMFIGECMDQIMKSAVEEPLSRHEDSEKPSRKGPKRKTKGRKGSAAVVKAEKPEIPIDSKVFDNPLSTEIDYNFLLNLPTYLNEVNLVPDDTLGKNSIELLTESCHCECTERTSCDEVSSADERTEVSSESLSLCDSETVDSFNSSFSTKVRKPGTHKKRRKNLTGWPTQKKRKPPVSVQASDDNDNSSFSFDDHKPKRRRSFMKRRTLELLEPRRSLQLESEGSDRRTSARKRSSVLYMDTWPLRFRNHK
ncbi:UNVERIFIED_CONTAM: hypothetical protein RMT77_001604 [Armadillidium vulgare]